MGDHGRDAGALPDSGDPGRRPPRPDELPKPALWPEPVIGHQPEAFEGTAEESAPHPAPGQKRLAFVAVALMLLGVIGLGVAVALTSWLALALGLVVGGAGAVIALRARIMEDVSISDTPGGPS